MADMVDVAVVGGGPAGAAVATLLARAGIATTLIERRASPEWHASGVFSSPRTRRHVAALGLPASQIAILNRPISALELETTRGSRCRLEYRHGFACGFDRLALERALLDRARAAGATVRQATVVRNVHLPETSGDPVRLALSATSAVAGSGATETLAARIVVGADGPTSLVARAAGVYRARRWFARSGITFHRSDPSAAPEGAPMAGRFVFGSSWYMGIAPVPHARVNIGIVVSAMGRATPAKVAQRLVEALPGPREPWMSAPATDRVASAGRLQHHAERAAGRGWLLVGDSIGFLDPLSGEGLLRAFVSAELAAEAIADRLRGDRRAFEDYDRRVRHRFYGKNAVSWMLQLFLNQPHLLDYALRRLAKRADLREQLTLVLTDQVPASQVVDPRFMARLIAP